MISPTWMPTRISMRWSVGTCLLRHSLLDPNGATGGVNGAAKLDPCSIAGALNRPPMLPDNRFQEIRGGAHRGGPAHPAPGSHQPTIPDNVCHRDDGMARSMRCCAISSTALRHACMSRLSGVYCRRLSPIWASIDPLASRRQGRKPGPVSGVQVDGALAIAERSACNKLT
jgi:hypothetical protein